MTSPLLTVPYQPPNPTTAVKQLCNTPFCDLFLLLELPDTINLAAELLQESFAFADLVNVKTCVGAEGKQTRKRFTCVTDEGSFLSQQFRLTFPRRFRIETVRSIRAPIPITSSRRQVCGKAFCCICRSRCPRLTTTGCKRRSRSRRKNR